MTLKDLRTSPMMEHLIDALEHGKDVGHYGRLTFVMVARFFAEEDEIVKLLTRDPACSEDDARQLYRQVVAHGYNPPKRNRILEWQHEQDFPICPNSEDPNACNVYRDLKFPDDVYEQIEEFWEQKLEADAEPAAAGSRESGRARKKAS